MPTTGSLDATQRLLHANPTLIPLIVLGIAVSGFGLAADPRFFSAFNLSLIIQQVSIIGILACAQTIIILTAGIDLSVAALMVLGSVIMGKLAVIMGVYPPFAIAMGLGVTTALGLVNGLLVTRLHLPAFIATLGTWNIFFALNVYYSEAQSIGSRDIDQAAPLLKFFGERVEVGDAVFTYGAFLMLALFVVLWCVLEHTAWGRHVYAVGDNKEAAELAGIDTDRLLLSVYALAGFLCGVAAWASIGRVGAISPQSFYEANLDAITAVVIGGVSLFGGRGSIFGVLAGALIVGVFSSGLKMAGVDVLWQRFAIGCLIIVAVALDQWIRKVSA
uniref:Mannose ABC transporter membrane protein /fructose ABC transporter membrane protein /ribose ABC transporter membrane protein n=1 Tax=Candidatus Kentrum sp. FW TaxID=2126338 RepID=A0A450SHT0_9GAMM|nr:MAG: mannose ABC transporter membrane protein /fructose ABC transporter membrane protein /ribose ABC transporter membrane protein [Candidatus Kentron sp. FW]